MNSPSRYAVPLDDLGKVQVPVAEQVETQAVHVDGEYVSPEDLDRARLLSPTSDGRLRVR